MPILYEHRVVPIPADIGSWSYDRRQAFLRVDTLPIAFAAQLDWLQAHGYTTILPRDLASAWDRGRRLPPNPVIIALDDGYREWITTVLPLLRERGMVAEFYVVAGDVGPGLTLSWDDLRTLSLAGNGIGAHDVHHLQLAMNGANVPPAPVSTMRDEVTRAKAILEAGLGRTVDSMAYVGGGWDDTLVGLVQEAGYTTARSLLRGVWQTQAARYTLHVSRIGVFDDIPGLDPCVGDPTPAVCTPADPLVVFPERVSGFAPG